MFAQAVSFFVAPISYCKTKSNDTIKLISLDLHNTNVNVQHNFAHFFFSSSQFLRNICWGAEPNAPCG